MRVETITPTQTPSGKERTMSFHNQQKAERKKRQAQARRDRRRTAQLNEHKNAAPEGAQNENPQPQQQEQTIPIAKFEPAAEPTALTDRDQLWQRYCSHVFKLQRWP